MTWSFSGHARALEKPRSRYLIPTPIFSINPNRKYSKMIIVFKSPAREQTLFTEHDIKKTKFFPEPPQNGFVVIL